MPRADVNGASLAYEIIGNGSRAVAITPGGRFSKDTPGVRALAEELAQHDCRVLIHDRPNCGESEVLFTGESETRQNADALAGLLRATGLGPALIVAASGGAREAIVTAIHHPDVVSGLHLQWLSGGGIGIATLPVFYCADAALAAATHGMEAVLDLPGWQEPLSRWPANRDRLLSQDRDRFVATMRRWADAYYPGDAPIPCVTRAQLAAITIPVTILRSGASDLHHPRETSEAVAALIPGAILAEPPWGDREWLERLDDSMAGRGGLFVNLPKLVPSVLATLERT
ncbi:alpha/beta fold hydrolase [Novosphingobium sp. TH158]|uniref:alpha/beta fold hydrolase n=1 Tax=Novosphingobium sp. TH158 TaxID=2067455 RepID=UPI000C7E3DF6|nr:alpha/beta hydrolase [Novosphingobium sp. TH158]PLK26178.1 alpha/beta hydrolase [Novosphingobium sp. TH158]